MSISEIMAWRAILNSPLKDLVGTEADTFDLWFAPIERYVEERL